MKQKFTALIAILMLMVIPAVAQADSSSASGSGYSVTTNYQGIFVLPPPIPPLQAKVSVLTGEKFDSLWKIKIDLRDPSENVVDTVICLKTDLVWYDGTAPNGKPIKWAWIGPLEPEAPYAWTVGDYSVKAYFYATDGNDIANILCLEAMRATTVMMVPEVPFGTIATLLAMFGALGVFALKKKQMFPIRIPS